jgi:LCP family protein required for cell wall assembly
MQTYEAILMKKAALAATLACVLMASACAWLPSTLSAGGPKSGPTTTPNPFATATPTAFGPATATAGPTETATPAVTPIPTFDASQPWGDFPAPVQPSAIEIRPPAEPIPFNADVVNILLLGSDARPYEGGYRTDVMMIASLDPGKGTATLISIPRDLYVYIPGWRVDRINTADPRGGPELAAQTLLYNFGIPIHYYARMNFWGFTELVDTLGGIDVDSTGYLYDECGGIWYQFSPGNTYHMNGFTALCYVRMRKQSSDFDRLRRQQEVISAIFQKILTLNGLSRVPELYRQFNGIVETDIGLQRAIQLLPLASHLAGNRQDVRRIAIDRSMATGWRVPYSGAAVLLPQWDTIEATLHDAFGS